MNWPMQEKSMVLNGKADENLSFICPVKWALSYLYLVPGSGAPVDSKETEFAEEAAGFWAKTKT